ncbi:TadA family conjugal transfer-associated ATPase [Demequina sediminicola]|uniref:TadA family conjugal transfer-associated ATPase n=1 Tax=Demequina sediminicola TaxID=1095026 RepID=UPI000785DC05|nr:TadA family conjugal transfer-associated ATPase [Demequina sediminicola]
MTDTLATSSARDTIAILRPPQPSAPYAGPLAPLLALPGVTDVLVNEPGTAWIDRGRGLERQTVDLPDAEAVRVLAVTLASAGGRRLDDASPLVDARLPDGTRLHAALPPIAPECAAISLRRVRSQALTLDDLAVGGMVSGSAVALVRELVRQRCSALVTGATGSGKTTLLASLLSEVDPTERILIIEEAGELQPDHPHVVRLVERRANIEGSGAIGLPLLVREAMRMRPDRVVLGECRGPEVREVLSVFNTGHRGGFATVHANSPADVPARLVALGALAGMSQRTVELQAGIAFDVILHVERSGGARRLASIAVLEHRDEALVAIEAVGWTAKGWRQGPGWQALCAVLGGWTPDAAA